MRALRRGILIAALVMFIAGLVVALATPGGVLTTRFASGQPTDRTSIAGLVALLVMGFAALGLDLRDLF